MTIQLDAKRLKYREYFQWAEGDLSTLFAEPTPTQVNGLTMIRPDEIPVRYQFFAAMSRFYYDAVLADIPAAFNPYMSLVRRLVRDWVITGEHCVVIWDGTPRAVRSDYVFPIVSEWDEEDILGYRLVYPQMTEQGSMTGKARVIVIRDGAATESVRDYYGGQLSADSGGSPVPISDVYWHSTGDGSFGVVKEIVREIAVRMAFLSSALNSSAYPLLQLDSALLGISNLKLNERDISVAARTGLGLLIPPPFIGEEGARFIEKSGGAMAESMAYIEELKNTLMAFTGYHIRPLNSDDDIERTLSIAITRVNRARRSLEETMREVGVNGTWSSQPFGNRKSKMDSVKQLVETGIITIEEARTTLGVE